MYSRAGVSEWRVRSARGAPSPSPCRLRTTPALFRAATTMHQVSQSQQQAADQGSAVARPGRSAAAGRAHGPMQLNLPVRSGLQLDRQRTWHSIEYILLPRTPGLASGWVEILPSCSPWVTDALPNSWREEHSTPPASSCWYRLCCSSLPMPANGGHRCLKVRQREEEQMSGTDKGLHSSPCHDQVATAPDGLSHDPRPLNGPRLRPTTVPKQIAGRQLERRGSAGPFIPCQRSR